MSFRAAAPAFAKKTTKTPPPEDTGMESSYLKALGEKQTPVSVKLVAVENVGTIAVGVAKAGANIIEIDGIGGGTGAAMLSSKEHAGLPSEMGLAEAHQALVLNGLRRSVKSTSVPLGPSSALRSLFSWMR